MANDDVNSSEQAYLEELRQAKERSLREYDLQAEQLGPFTPPYVHLERKRLREELGIVKKVIASPLGANLGDELGEKNRFVGYLTEIHTVGQAVERLEARVAQFIEDSMDWRGRISLIIITIIVALVLIGLFVAFQLGRLSDAEGAIQGLLR